MKKRLLLILLGIAFSYGISAQIIYEEKNSIHLDNGFSYETTSVLGEDGLIVVSKNEDDVDNNLEWHFDKFFKDLGSDQKVKVMLNEDLELKNSFFNSDHLHYIFLDEKNHFAILSLEITSLKMTKVFGDLPKLLDINDMTLFGDYTYITGELNNKPYACSINWKTGAVKILPLIIQNMNQKDIVITGLQVIESLDELFIFANTEVDEEKIESYVFRFNSNGNVLNYMNLTPKNDQFLLELNVSHVSNDQIIFTGTYSSGEADCSKGIFFCQTTNNLVDFITFYPYDQINDFNKYLTKEQIEQLEEQKNDDEDFREETRLNFRVIIHDLIPDNGGYLFVGELFYPRYETSISSYYDDSGIHNRTVFNFDGYKYSHGIICKFDNQGDLIWSQSFELDNLVKTFEKKRFINLDLQTQNEIKIAFPNNFYIKTKSYDYNGNLLIDHSSNNIQEIDGINYREIQNFNLAYWYDQYFIAYGSIKLVNKNDEDIYHDLFYMDKIEYDHYKVIKESNKAE